MMKRFLCLLMALALVSNLSLSFCQTALADQYPSSYSIVSKGLSSPIRDQKDIGSCFIFAITGAIENRLRAKAITTDLSEWAFYKTYLRYYPKNVYNTPLLDVPVMAGRLAAIGPENKAPYPASAAKAYEISKEAAQMSNWMASDIYVFTADEFKDYLMRGYEIVVVTNVDDKYVKGPAIYCYDDAETANVNHEVTIVGWDDNYSRFNFPRTPSRNGAWLVRNSWGTGAGERGYYWLSYEDSIIKYSGGAALDVIPGITYQYLQQYDYYGWNYWFGLKETSATIYGNQQKTIYMANQFTAEHLQQVEAVGFYATGKQLSYKIWVCESVDAFDPSAAPNGEYTARSMGYHVVKLNSSYVCNEGEKYAVVVQIDAPQKGYWVPLDQAGYYNQPGKGRVSFVSADGAKWLDATVGLRTPHGSLQGNVCLKAYANPASAPKPRPTASPRPTNPPAAPTPTPKQNTPSGGQAAWLDHGMLRIDYSLMGKTHDQIKNSFDSLTRPVMYPLWADHLTVSYFNLGDLSGMVFFQNDRCAIVCCEEVRHFNSAIADRASQLFGPSPSHTWQVPGEKCQFVLSMEVYPIVNTEVFRQWYFADFYDGYRGEK